MGASHRFVRCSEQHRPFLDPPSSMVGSNMLVVIAAAIVYLLLCR